MTNSLMHPISRAVNTLPLQDETCQTQIYVSCTSAKISCHFWKNTMPLLSKYHAAIGKNIIPLLTRYHTISGRIASHFWQNIIQLLTRYHTIFGTIASHFWQNIQLLTRYHTIFSVCSL